MRDDHLTDAELAAYVEGVVRAEERARMESHLIHCTGCLDEVLALLRIVRPDEMSEQPP
jgi:anti-sigma factor RsiW